MNHEKTLDVRSNPAPPSGLADFADPVRLPGQQSAREDVVKCDQTSTIARGIADTVPPRLTHLPVVQAVVQNRQNRQDVQNARGLLEAGWLQGLLALAGPSRDKQNDFGGYYRRTWYDRCLAQTPAGISPPD